MNWFSNRSKPVVPHRSEKIDLQIDTGEALPFLNCRGMSRTDRRIGDAIGLEWSSAFVTQHSTMNRWRQQRHWARYRQAVRKFAVRREIASDCRVAPCQPLTGEEKSWVPNICLAEGYKDKQRLHTANNSSYKTL